MSSPARFIPALCGALLCAWGAGAVRAQDPPAVFPDHPVRLVVPFSAGSQSDILARAYGEELSVLWGQPLIIDNRPGLPGTASVAKAPADGYTLMAISNGHTIIGALNDRLAFDPVKDFSGVARIAVVPGIFVAPPTLGAETLAQFIAMAKARPGALNYASAGLGSASSIAVELLKRQAGIDLAHVPYKGLPEANLSIMRGEAQLFMTFYSASADLIRDNRLHALAVTGAKRLAALPDVPTIGEAGLRTYDFEPWFGILAPAGTSLAAREKIARDINAAAQSPKLKMLFEKLGVNLDTLGPEAFDALVSRDTQSFSNLFARGAK